MINKKWIENISYCLGLLDISFSWYHNETVDKNYIFFGEPKQSFQKKKVMLGA